MDGRTGFNMRIRGWGGGRNQKLVCVWLFGGSEFWYLINRQFAKGGEAPIQTKHLCPANTATEQCSPRHEILLQPHLEDIWGLV